MLLVHVVAPYFINVTNTQLIFLRLMLKMRIITTRNLPRFPNTSEMFPLKMTR